MQERVVGYQEGDDQSIGDDEIPIHQLSLAVIRERDPTWKGGSGDPVVRISVYGQVKRS